VARAEQGAIVEVGTALLNNGGKMEINILGTQYTIIETDTTKDSFLDKCDGYCDKTSKKIVVLKESKDCELDDFRLYKNKVLRHEIIHAFLFESGLHENWQHQQGHDESYVDWIATQFTKLQKAFEEADCTE
jgi:hypothetical protein